MQARFRDPRRPRGQKWVRQIPAFILLLTALAGGFSPVYLLVLLGLSVIASSALALLPSRDTRTLDATLELGPGQVVVRAGRRREVVHAKEITGASTTKTKRGFALTMAREKADAPTTLEVESEAEVDRLRLALGIGHGGHGTLGWWTTPSASQRTAFGGRIVSIVATLAVMGSGGLLAATGDGAWGGVLALASLFAFFAIPIGVIASLFGDSASSPEIIMTPSGIWLLTTAGPFTLPYAYYGGVTREGDMLVFRVPPPWNVVYVPVGAPTRGSGLTDDDVTVLRAQLDGAALRARGYGRSKEEVAGRVEVLRRGNALAKDWLARLDMLGSTLATGGGYRGQSLDAEDLWMVLEDPDADIELRTAAARVLRHLGEPKVKVRIDAAVAAIRDEDANLRVRVAADDPLEDAAEHLDDLDLRARQKMVG